MAAVSMSMINAKLVNIDGTISLLSADFAGRCTLADRQLRLKPM